MFRNSNQFSRHAYVGLREIGAVQPIQNYFQRTYAALHPASYHRFKSTCQTESEWLGLHELDQHVQGFDITETVFLNAILAGDINSFRSQLSTLDVHTLLQDVSYITMLELNPFSPFQINYSKKINDEMWAFITNTIHDSSLLEWAVITHQPTTVFENLYLSLAGTVTNQARHSCLASAAFLNQTEIVRFMLQQNVSPNPPPEIEDLDNPSRSALSYACANGNFEMVKLLLDAGADVHRVDNDDLLPLQLACVSGDPRIVRLLLERGANVHGNMPLNHNEESLPPIVMVCKSGNLECVKVLVEYGAYIKNENTTDYFRYVESYDAAFHLPAFEACMAGHLDIAEFLISKDADINTYAKFYPISVILLRNQECAFIHYACLKRDYALIKFLLKFGADINDHDGSFSTPVHLACMSDTIDLEFISFLVEETNADWFLRDEAGVSPLDYLYQREDFDEVNLIYILEHFLKHFDLVQATLNMDADMWSDVYKLLVVKVAADCPDLLLQYALLANQDADEIDRIIALGAKIEGHAEYKYTPYALAEICYPEMKHKFSPGVSPSTLSYERLDWFGIFHDSWDDLEPEEPSYDGLGDRKRSRSPSMNRFSDSDD